MTPELLQRAVDQRTILRGACDDKSQSAALRVLACRRHDSIALWCQRGTLLLTLERHLGGYRGWKFWDLGGPDNYAPPAVSVEFQPAGVAELIGLAFNNAAAIEIKYAGGSVDGWREIRPYRLAGASVEATTAGGLRRFDLSKILAARKLPQQTRLL